LGANVKHIFTITITQICLTLAPKPSKLSDDDIQRLSDDMNKLYISQENVESISTQLIQSNTDLQQALIKSLEK